MERNVLEIFNEMIRESTDEEAVKAASEQLAQYEEAYDEYGMQTFGTGDREFQISDDGEGNKLYEITENGQKESITRDRLLHIMEGEINPDILKGSELGNIHIDTATGTLFGREVFENGELAFQYHWLGEDGLYQYPASSVKAYLESIDRTGVNFEAYVGVYFGNEQMADNNTPVLTEEQKDTQKSDSINEYDATNDTANGQAGGQTNETKDAPQSQSQQKGPTAAAQDPLRDIKAIADENYRNAEKTAQRNANSVLNYMKSVENSAAIDQVIGNTAFRTERAGDGNLTFLYNNGTEYVRISEYEMRNRITNAMMQEARNERDRDADAVIYGEAGILSVNKEKNPQSGVEEYQYRWKSWDGTEYPLTEESIAEYAKQNGWDREYVEQHSVRNERVAQQRHENEERMKSEPERKKEDRDERMLRAAGMAALIQQIAMDNYREVNSKAQRYAQQNLSYAERSCEPGNSVLLPVGESQFLIQKDDNGRARYFAGEERKEISKETLLNELAAAQTERVRTEMNRSKDFALGTTAGVLIASANKDGVNFTLMDGYQETPLMAEDVNKLTEGMTDRDILENNRGSVSEAWKDHVDLKEAAAEQMARFTGQTATVNRNMTYTDPELGAESVNFLVKKAAEANQQPKRALREALRIATKTNNDINREVTDRMQGVLERMETECPAGGQRSITINGNTFTVSRDESGELHYTADIPEPGQVVGRSTMRQAMFLSEKREVVEELKANGHDELAIIPLNEKQMLIIRSEDLERADKNAFVDGNKDFNFYLKDANGNETQVTQRQVNEIFKNNGIETERDVRERLTTSYEKAKQMMLKLGKTAARAAGRGVKRGLEFATIRQLADGFRAGEEMARM